MKPHELGTVERAYADGYAAAQHEIERLRAALRGIAGMEGEEGIDDHKFAERALKIANDALAE